MRNRLLQRALFASVIALSWLGAGLPAHAQIDATLSRGDSDAFVEATVDMVNPWVGQQVVYTFRYFEAQDAARLPSILSGPPDYKAPAFSNFWVEGDIEQNSFQAESGGRPYDVSELHTRLFPTVAGALTIEPARLILNDLPQQGERTLETLPAILNVRPLPGGAPAGFGGAVGDFRLSAKADRTTTQVDEPIALRLTLIGRGNIGMASPPALPEMPGWRVLESGSDLRIDVVDGLVGGMRTWDYQLIPTQPGSIEVPSLEYLFFDPATESYKGSLTDPLRLTVEGSAVAAPATATAAIMTLPVTPAEPDVAAKQPDALAPPVSAATQPTETQASTAPMVESGSLRAIALVEEPWFWALWSLPFLAVVVAVGATIGERRRAGRRQQRSHARAGHDALRALSPGAPRQADAAAQCAAAQRVLDDYLGRKLGRPVTGLTRSALSTLLAQRGAGAPLIAQVMDCYRQSEAARFNPGGVEPNSGTALQTNVQTTIRQLEKVLRS